MTLKDRWEEMKREWKLDDPSITPKLPVWPSLEKAARAWAKREGLDETEFITWLKKKAKEREPKQIPFTHAEASHPED